MSPISSTLTNRLPLLAILACGNLSLASEALVGDDVIHFRNGAEPRDGIFFCGNNRAVVIKGYRDAMMVQFTGARMSIGSAEA